MRRRFLAAMFIFYAALVGVLVFGPQVLANRSPVPATTCSGTVTHQSIRDVTVQQGAVCRVSDSTVNGSVTVLRDAYFEASGTKISGSVQATGALAIFLHDGTSVGGSVLIDGAPQFFLYKTTVAGSVKVTGATAPGFGHVQVCETTAGSIEVRGSGPDVLVGDPQGGCAGNQVKRNVVISGNNTMSELEVSGNDISGSLYVTGNTGASPKNVHDNSVRGVVDLSENAAPFDAANN